MKGLYKITLLITMAVVTWKVVKTEKNDIQSHCSAIVSSSRLEKLLANSRDFRYS